MWGVVFIAALLLLAWVLNSRRVPSGVFITQNYRDIHPESYDKVIDAARAFETERQKWKPNVYILETHRFYFEKYGREIERRLPNDLTLERELQTQLDTASRILEDHIQRVRKRAPTTRVEYAYPYPLGDYFDRDFFDGTQK